MIESAEISHRLNNEGRVVVIPGNAYPERYEVVQARWEISSFFDSRSRDVDHLIQARHREIDAWDYLHRGLAGDPGVAIGIAPSDRIAPEEFARLPINDVVVQALRGQGRPDIWLVAARAEPGRGKFVLDGAIAAEKIRRARWMEVRQGSQVAFVGNGLEGRS